MFREFCRWLFPHLVTQHVCCSRILHVTALFKQILISRFYQQVTNLFEQIFWYLLSVIHYCLILSNESFHQVCRVIFNQNRTWLQKNTTFWSSLVSGSCLLKLKRVGMMVSWVFTSYDYLQPSSWIHGEFTDYILSKEEWRFPRDNSKLISSSDDFNCCPCFWR